ncbi:MAG: CoA-binding domain protein, partial [Frankiales bacterium]|nr:CoA-binding domain protein [Frankiales bacterium]
IPEASSVLAAYGVRTWPTSRVSSVEQAVEAAQLLGWPVALKHPDDRWRNRVDLGAVRLSLDDPSVLAAEWNAIQELLGPTDLLVQPMAAPGVSTVVRLVQDAAVGPLISLRLGGVAADLLADPMTRTLPLTDLDAAELVGCIRGASLLEGHDTLALQDVLHRVAQLGEDHPEVAEVLLDPVLVGREGVTVLHAGVRLLPPEVDPERMARRVVGQSASHLR